MHWVRVSSTTILAIALIAAFSLHSIEFEHGHGPVQQTHQQQSDNTYFSGDEYVHGIEQKFFLAILLTLFAFGWFVVHKPWSNQYTYVAVGAARPFSLIVFNKSRETDVFVYLYRKGILNPKLH